MSTVLQAPWRNYEVSMSSDTVLGTFPRSSSSQPLDIATFTSEVEYTSTKIRIIGDGVVTILEGQFNVNTAQELEGTVTAAYVGYLSSVENGATANLTTLDPETAWLFGPYLKAQSIDLPLSDYVTALAMNTPGHSGYDPDAARTFFEEKAFEGDDEIHVGGFWGEPSVVHGHAGDDTILLLDSGDMLTAFGDGGDDTIVGSTGSEVMLGGAGNDAIFSQGGTDTIEGGLGNDLLGIYDWDNDYPLGPSANQNITLMYEADSTDAKITIDVDVIGPNLWTIDDVDGSKFGKDQVFGADVVVQFDDAEWANKDAYSLARMGESDIHSLIEIYIAHFNRAPDALGLHFWAGRLDDGMTLKEISAYFFASVESLILRPADMTNADYVKEIYQNVLGRDPDEGGLAFWAGVLDSGAIDRSDFMLNLLRGVSVIPTDVSGDLLDQYEADRAYLDSKTDIGIYFSMIKGLSDVEDSRAAMQSFENNPTNIQAVKDQIDNFAQDAMDADTGDFVVQILGVIDDPFAI